jgi:hypothetical protein
MNQNSWMAAPDGRYWIDVVLGNMPIRLMLDTGLVDPRGQVGFEIEPQLYDSLERSNQLVAAGLRKRRDSSGRSIRMQTGWVSAHLLDVESGSYIGPRVQLSAWRGFANVPNRVGVLFFHQLAGCRVVWDLDARLWSVEYP